MEPPSKTQGSSDGSDRRVRKASTVPALIAPRSHPSVRKRRRVPTPCAGSENRPKLAVETPLREKEAGMATAEGYARPELLAEPDWLWERQDDSKLRIIDCASLDRYRRAHIPGAVGLPVDGWLKDSENKLHVIGPKAFAELMEKLGVSDDTRLWRTTTIRCSTRPGSGGCSGTTATPTPGSSTASGIAG